MQRDPATERRLNQLAAAGAATHAVAVQAPVFEELDGPHALSDAMGVDATPPESVTISALVQLCGGQVTRITETLFAIDATEMSSEALEALPDALSRRLFGPGWPGQAVLEALPEAPIAELLTGAGEKTIDWADCEVRLEDVVAELARRAETSGADEARARSAIESHAQTAIAAVQSRSEAAIDRMAEAMNEAAARVGAGVGAGVDGGIAAGDVARVIEDRIEARLGDDLAERIDTHIEARVTALLERLSSGETAQPQVAPQPVAVETAPADERSVLSATVETLGAMMTEMQTRAAEVSEIADQIRALRAAFDPQPDATVEPETEASSGVADAVIDRLSGPVSPFGPYAVSLDRAPILPGEMSLVDLVAQSGTPRAI